MAYTDDAVKSKLSALNESHESIATAAQWIMFHRRHADRTVQLWHQRLKESNSSKRLNLIYLANEVTQQSKARHKDDFVVAFSPVIGEATSTAYKGATSELQSKLRKVIAVWRDRAIFEAPIQDAIEKRIEEFEKARGGAGAALGGSIFASSSSASVPLELKPLVLPQQAVSALLLSTQKAASDARQEYDKTTDPSAEIPKPPVYAARLNGLLKKLATAETAVQESVNARTHLVEALEKLLGSSKAALAADQAQLEQLSSRKAAIDKQKNDVEESILTGLAAHTQAPIQGDGVLSVPEPDRPEVEALTPPPPGDDTLADDYLPAPAPAPVDQPGPAPISAEIASPTVPSQGNFQPPAAPGIELLSNLASQYQAVPVLTNGSNKRRRVDTGDDFPDLGNDDVDPDVQEMLRNDSHVS